MCLRFAKWLDDRKWDRQWERDRPMREARERAERERERAERERERAERERERDFEYNFGSLQENQNEHVDPRLAYNALSSLRTAFQQENIAELANAVQLRVHRDALEPVHAEATRDDELSDDSISWLESRRTISTLVGVIQDSWTSESLHRQACELLEILLKTRPNNQELVRSEGGLPEFIIDDVSRTHRVQLQQRTATYNALAALVKRNRANQDAARDAGAIRSVVTGLKRYFKDEDLFDHPRHIELHLAALKALYALIEGNTLSQEQAQNDGVFDTLSPYIEKYSYFCTRYIPYRVEESFPMSFRGLCRVSHELVRTGTWDRDRFRGTGTLAHLLNSLNSLKEQALRDVWCCLAELAKGNLTNCNLIICRENMSGLCTQQCAHTLLPRLLCLHAFVREGETFRAMREASARVDSIAHLIIYALPAVTACKILEESGTFVRDAWKTNDKKRLIDSLNSHVVSSLDEEIRIHACRAIRTVVRNDAWLQCQFHDDIFITTIVDHARHFDGGNTTFVHELIMTMRELVRGCETMQLAFQHKGALSCLADLLRMRPVIETFLRESVYEAAAELMLGNEEMISLAAEEGFLGLLRTSSESSPAAERLLEVLSSGATINFHDAIDMQGIIETIRHSRGDVCALIDKLKSLSRLLVGNYAFQEHAGECGAVSTCAEVMQWYVDDYNVQMAGLRCLLALTNGNIRNQRESADLSLFSTIFVAMRAHGTRTELQTLGNAVLDMIVIRVLDASEENDGGHRHIAAINETSQNERSKVEMLLHRVAGSREHDREALLQFMDQADELCSEMLEGEYLALVNDLKQRYERLLER